MDFKKWKPFWTTCFGRMAFLIIVGNTLTVTTPRKKKHFENVHSFCWSVWPLLISWLGVTILYVIDVYGLFALSFVFFNMLDMFAGFSSIFHLAVISLERLHETLPPFRHWQLSLEAYWVAIATPWTLSLFLCTFNLHTGKVSPEPTSSGSYYCYNLPSNSIAYNIFFLPGNLEKR